MLIVKVIALIVSLVILTNGALKIKTEIGFWGFLATITSLVWLLAE